MQSEDGSLALAGAVRVYDVEARSDLEARGMESPRRRRGGAEQPTCWSSVVRFPRLSFAAELPAVGPRPLRGRRGLRSKRDPAKSHDRLPAEVDPSASDVSAFPPASGSSQTLTPMCAPSHVSHRTRARHSQLKALCCVDLASDHARRRDSGGTVSSEEHDSPLVARRDFASSSGREAVP